MRLTQLSASSGSFLKLNEDDRAQLFYRIFRHRSRKSPAPCGMRGAKLAPLWEETGVNQVLQVPPTKGRDGGHITNRKGA